MGRVWVCVWSVQAFWDHEVCSLEKIDEGLGDVVAVAVCARLGLAE